MDALTYYLQKKQIDLQVELLDTVRQLYEKHLPSKTRAYIDDKVEREGDAPETQIRPARAKVNADKTGDA